MSELPPLPELLDRIDLGLIWLDRDGRIGLINRWVMDLASFAEPPQGSRLEDCLQGSIDPKLLRAVHDALRLGRATRLSHAFHPTPLPLRSRKGDAQQRLQQAVDVIPSEHHGEPGCLIQVRDLTEVQRREQLLKQQARQLSLDLGELRLAQDELTRHTTRLRELTRLAPIALFETDLNGHLIYCNDRFSVLWGAKPGQMAGLLGRHWSALMPAEAMAALAPVWAELMTTPERVQRDVRIASNSGEERWLQLEASTLRNLDGEAFGFLASLVDVSAHYRRARHLEHRANHDALTGLPNRERLRHKLDGALAAAERLGQRLALVYLDLDGFKRVNDEHGHAAGDALLQALAQRMRRTVRAEDLVARLSGDEFVLLFADSPTPAQVGLVMSKLERVLGEPVLHEGQALQVACSWGLAQFPEDGPDGATLLAAADARMYAHKQARAELGLRVERAQ